ncbi:MAG: TolC family protein [Planctomycetes bacterium]|nr:TolC family protein [Planctomycetota bacterium]
MALPVLLCLVASGCTESSLRDELDKTRAQAYQDWEKKNEEGKKAQPYLKGKLSLEDAIKLSLKYNRDIHAAIEDKAVADGVLLESWSSALPKVSAGADYTRRDSLGDPAYGYLNNYSTNLTVVQPVFNGGRIIAALNSGKYYSMLADEQVRGAVQQVIYNVMSTYYAAILNKHLYNVNRDAVESAQAQLKDVEIKQENEVASEFDVLRAQVDVANFQADMIRAKNDVEIAHAQLLKYIGARQDSTVELSDELEFYPMKPVFEKAVEVAYRNRPDLFVGELGVRLQEEAVRVAKSEYFPVVSAFFTKTWANPDPYQRETEDEWGSVWNAGGKVEFNIFDGFGREGRLMQEKANLRKRHVELLDTQDKARLQVKNAILNIRNAEILVDSQKLNVKRAIRGLELAKISLAEGVKTQVEVTDARAALTLARGNFYRAVYSHNIARLDLKLGMGILGPLPGFKGDPSIVNPPKAEDEIFGVQLEKKDLSGDEVIVPKVEAGGPVRQPE